MKKNFRLLLLIIGIAVVLYTFLSLQYLLGIAAAVIIAIALIVIPYAQQRIKSP
jgi:predicted membrane protein